LHETQADSFLDFNRTGQKLEPFCVQVRIKIKNVINKKPRLFVFHFFFQKAQSLELKSKASTHLHQIQVK